jgi:hypothetical protein
VERSAVEDLWRITLSQIPSELGKLAYLASLRHPNTGVYRHAGLAMRSGSVLADEALRISHERIFRAWLTLSLRKRTANCIGRGFSKTKTLYWQPGYPASRSPTGHPLVQVKPKE